MYNTRIIATLFAASLAYGLVSCDSSTGSDDKKNTPGTEYATDTAVVDYKGLNQVVYFDFSTGVKTVLPHDTWQIAFDSDRFLIANGGNYGSGVAACSTGHNDFSADFSAWKDSLSRFTRTDTNYNVLGTTYKSGPGMGATYTNQVYLVKTDGGKFYKFQVTGALAMGAGLRMKIGELSASTAVEDTFKVATGYNYTFVDLAARKTVNVEPPSDQWDIRFGRTEFLMGTSTGGRSAIVLNAKGGVRAAVVAKENLSDVSDFSAATFRSDILAIGERWYDYDMSTKIFELVPEIYVFQTTEGHYAKLRMTTFNGPKGEVFYSLFKYLYQASTETSFEK